MQGKAGWLREPQEQSRNIMDDLNKGGKCAMEFSGEKSKVFLNIRKDDED